MRESHERHGVIVRQWIQWVLTILLGLMLLVEVRHMGLGVGLAAGVTAVGVAMGLWRARSAAVVWDGNRLEMQRDRAGTLVLVLYLVLRFGIGSAMHALEPGDHAATFGSATALMFGYIGTKAVTMGMAIRKAEAEGPQPA